MRGRRLWTRIAGLPFTCRWFSLKPSPPSGPRLQKQAILSLAFGGMEVSGESFPDSFIYSQRSRTWPVCATQEAKLYQRESHGNIGAGVYFHSPKEHHPELSNGRVCREQASFNRLRGDDEDTCQDSGARVRECFASSGTSVACLTSPPLTCPRG